MNTKAFVAKPARGKLAKKWLEQLSKQVAQVTVVDETAAANDLLGLAREACKHCPDGWVVLVAANARLPNHLITRLIDPAPDRAVLIAPLSDTSEHCAPFTGAATDHHLDAATTDATVWLHGERRWIPQALVNGPVLAIHCRRAKSALSAASSWPTFCQSLVDQGSPPLLSDSVYAASEQSPDWKPAKQDPGDPPPPHPLTSLRSAMAQVQAGSDYTSLPGADEKPVLLHITHSWGGGVRRWVEDFCQADSEHHHLWLMSAGQSSGRVHGQRLTLRCAEKGKQCIAQWPLELSIASTAKEHTQYQQVLAEIRRRFAIDGVVVSSLVGHSLDALRTDLATTVVCHDYFPISPNLELRFEDDQAKQALPGNQALFGDAQLRDWQVVRDQYRALTDRDNVTLVAPSDSVRKNRVSLDSKLGTQAVRIIPHGMRPWPQQPNWRYVAPKPNQRLRLLVPGQMSTAKGRELLLTALPQLNRFADIYLLGVGRRQGERFFGLNGVHVVHAYQWQQLPELVENIRPHAGLLLSLVSESFSYTLSELWSLGLPPIAMRSGALSERIDDGVSGILVHADADSLVATINSLQTDPALLAKISSNLARLDDRTLQQMVDDYRPLLPNRHDTKVVCRDSTATDGQLVQLESRLRGTVDQLERLQAQSQEHQSELARRRQWALGLERQLAKRTQWAEKSEAALADARNKLDALNRELNERGEWASSLEADLNAARDRLESAVKLADRHAKWGKGLESDLEKARGQLDKAHQELEDKTAWAKSLDVRLNEAAGEIERLSQWAASIEADRDQARYAFSQLQTEFEQRSAWAKKLDSELQHVAARLDQSETSLAETSQQLEHAYLVIHSTEAEREAARQRVDELDQILDDRTQWARSLDQENRQMQQRIQDLSSEIEQLSQTNHELTTSRSWRLTRPLRGVGRLLRRIKASIGFRTRRALGVQRRLTRSLKVRGVGGTIRRIRQELKHDRVPLVEIGELPTELLPFTLQVADQPVVSIVIPVYNQIQHTYHCLASIARFASDLAIEVIVVNDCSSDETPDVLTRIRGLRVLHNEQNMGFVDSCNRGVDMARGQYVVLLNNDTAVSENWLDTLYETFEFRPDAGLVGSQLVYPDGRLQESGGIIFSDGSGWNYGRLQDAADPRYNYLREVDYCSGAAIMFKRELFRELGGFDTRYRPAYYEDTDLAFKMREAGYKVYVQPASRVTHYEGITSGTDLTQGVKQYQVVNQSKFLDRWAEALAMQPEPTDQVETIKEFRIAKRVLIVDACTPEPDKDSGSVRMMNLFELMQQLGYKTTFMADNLAYVEKYSQDLQKRGVEVLYHPWTTASAVFTERGNSFDVIILSRHYIASKYVDLVRTHAPQAKLLFDTVDLHYLREQRHAELEQSQSLARTAQSTRKMELGVARASDVTLVVSPYEKEVLAKELPEAKVAVLSNIHRVKGRSNGYDDRKDIMFVGGYQHPPNIDAAKWFCLEILPLVRTSLPQLTFHLIGSKATPEVSDLGQLDGVEFHGFVPAIEPWLDNCRLAVAPLRYGAGVKGKVNSSMSHGQPVVATSPAVEGMHVVIGKDVLVADDAQSFAAEVVRLYNDPELWQTLSENGLENVRKYFSFESAKAALEDILS